MNLRTLLLLAFVFFVYACEKVEMPPPRPTNVPEEAVWAGGEDGGAWIDCSLDIEKGANFCTVYFDRDGDVWARTHFVLRDSGTGLPKSELTYSGFDGLVIYLSEGRVLEPLRYHLGEKISLAPIDNGPNSDAE
jgi:hypothetical protein